LTIDIKASEIQTVVDIIDALPFGGIQQLYSMQIVVTGHILHKNRRNHPEMDELYCLLADVCSNADYVCHNKRDTEVAICYKTVGATRLRAALWLKQAESPAEVHNSVLSYRLFHEKELADEIKQGRVVYSREK
jgi:hypothetical protein